MLTVVVVGDGLGLWEVVLGNGAELLLSSVVIQRVHDHAIVAVQWDNMI